MKHKQRTSRIKTLFKRKTLPQLLELYDTRLSELRSVHGAAAERCILSQLTPLFLDGYSYAMADIEARGKTEMGKINAVKQSAGMNFQGLIEYAIIRWLDTTNLDINVNCSLPSSLRAEISAVQCDAEGCFTLSPDLDICLWQNNKINTPVLVISAKTSLGDRAGSAARWKLYLDALHLQRPFQYCLVTGNIKSMPGELRSLQCRSNTYMFQHRFTCRNDHAQELRQIGSIWKILLL